MDWIVIGWIVVIGASIVIVLVGLVSALLTLRPKRQCACFQYQGDNRDCPIRDHRNIARSVERKER